MELSNLQKEWKNCKEGSFSNGPGKRFMAAFSSLFACIFLKDKSGQQQWVKKFKATYATTSGGKGPVNTKDTQHGSAHVYNKRSTRSSEVPSTLTDENVRRYTDASVYSNEDVIRRRCSISELGADAGSVAASPVIYAWLDHQPNQCILYRDGDEPTLNLFSIKPFKWADSEVICLQQLARLHILIFLSLKLSMPTTLQGL